MYLIFILKTPLPQAHHRLARNRQLSFFHFHPVFYILLDSWNFSNGNKDNRMFLIIILFLFAGASFPVLSQETYTLRGRITDEQIRQPLPSANIWVEGTSRGTVSNRFGEYQLPVSRGEHSIIVSYIGYRSDTSLVKIPDQLEHNAALSSIPIILPEVVITGEDPAIEIIRRAIENKPRWRGELVSFIGSAFARDKLTMNNNINTISEAYSDIYWHRDFGMQEIVTQRRQSANLPDEFQLARMGEIMNFNDDEIELVDFVFIGVTAPDALRYYDYKLTGIRKMDDIEIYDIKVIPKTRLQPLFKGYISIADETYAVVDVDLTPNEAFHIPIIQQLYAHYRQQFRLYEERFWMPSNFQFTAGFTLSLPGWRIGDFIYEKSTVIYDYEINTEIHDTVFADEETFVIAGEAATFDSTFWDDHNVLPLTPDEIRAYDRIDSLVADGGNRNRRAGSLDNLFRPLEYFDGRFNRVEGFYLGGKIHLDTITPYARVFGSLGYGFSDKQWKYSAGGVLYPSGSRMFGLGSEIFSRTSTIPKEQYFGSFAVAVGALFDKKDYLDYFLADGWRGFFEVNIHGGPRFRRSTTRIELGYIDEKHTSMEKNTDFSVFFRSRKYKANPVIPEGRLRGLTLLAERKPSSDFLLLPADLKWKVSLEHTSPSFTGSDYDYTRLFATLQGRFATMYGRHALSPVLTYLIAGGTSSGDVPIQRFFELDSDLSGLAKVGTLRGMQTKEFGGDHFVQLSLEHNFRRIPFLALGIPIFYELGWEFIVHASVARSWAPDTIPPESHYLPRGTNGWYTEAGIGIGKIFEFFRVDLTLRLMEPQGVHLSFGFSELF